MARQSMDALEDDELYKRHKRMIGTLTIISFFASLLLQVNYNNITNMTATIMSIALVAYMVVMSALLGSPYAKELKGKPDSQIPTQTMLGTLAHYFRWAGRLGIITIVISCIYKLKPFVIENKMISSICSALSCSIFSINILFILLIFVFLVNSLTKSVQNLYFIGIWDHIGSQQDFMPHGL